MATFRFPGILGLVDSAMPPDSATLARTNTPPPVPLGGNSRRDSLSAAEREYIEKEVGKKLDGSLLPLSSLLGLYDKQIRLYEEAAGEVGPQSGAAQYIRAIAERLAELIAEAGSPRGMAVEKLSRQLEQARASSGPIRVDQFSEAIAELFAAERERQLQGRPDGTGESAMALFIETAEFIYERKTEELDKLVEEASRSGNKVTEEQLGNVVREVLGVERQRQLLGAGDDDSGGSRAMELAVKAMEVVHQRRNKALKEIVEQAKRPGSTVTDEQLSKAIAAILGSERQRQLLGAAEDSAGGSESMHLVAQALDVAQKRHKATMKSLVESAQRPGSTITKAQIDQAVVAVLGDERQRQLLGVTDGIDPETSALLDAAATLYGEQKKATPEGAGSGTVEITVGEIQRLRHMPFR